MISFFRSVIAGLLLAMTPAVARGQASQPVVDSVAASIARYDRAWNSRDTATVNGLLAPEYQYFTSRGKLNSRVETMRFLASPDYQLERAARTDVGIRVSGPVAIASSRWQGNGRYRGKAFVDNQLCGQTWVRGAAWQLVSEHCVQIAPVAEPSN
jgi:hypothetical protein